MVTRRILTVALPLFVLAACNPFRREPAVQVSTQDATLNTRWHGNLASPSSLAGAVQMNGTASMAPNSDSTGTEIRLDLANAAPGGVHPWSAHWGQCGNGSSSGMLGSSEAYEPIKVGSDGRATGTANLSMQTPRSGSYFVVIYASVANDRLIVACGNLAPPTQ